MRGLTPKGSAGCRSLPAQLRPCSRGSWEAPEGCGQARSGHGKSTAAKQRALTVVGYLHITASNEKGDFCPLGKSIRVESVM